MIKWRKFVKVEGNTLDDKWKSKRLNWGINSIELSRPQVQILYWTIQTLKYKSSGIAIVGHY